MQNRIKIYQNNTTTIACTVIGGLDLTGFTPHFTVKGKASDIGTLLSKTGIVSDPSTTVTFAFTSIDTSMAPGSYVYDVVIDTSTQTYTLVKDIFEILDGVRY